ncbi:MAG: hypothetical protein WCI30_07005 [Clostridia bacterium]
MAKLWDIDIKEILEAVCDEIMEGLNSADYDTRKKTLQLLLNSRDMTKHFKEKNQIQYFYNHLSRFPALWERLVAMVNNNEEEIVILTAYLITQIMRKYKKKLKLTNEQSLAMSAALLRHTDKDYAVIKAIYLLTSEHDQELMLAANRLQKIKLWQQPNFLVLKFYLSSRLK